MSGIFKLVQQKIEKKYSLNTAIIINLMLLVVIILFEILGAFLIMWSSSLPILEAGGITNFFELNKHVVLRIGGTLLSSKELLENWAAIQIGMLIALMFLIFMTIKAWLNSADTL